MKPIIWAAIVITIALVFYTIGFVLSWQKKYPGAFWMFFLGWLLFDVPGTITMYAIAGQIKFNWHTVPGMIGFVLMAGAAVLAMLQIMNFQEKLMPVFRPIENLGYAIWLISYIVGAASRL